MYHKYVLTTTQLTNIRLGRYSSPVPLVSSHIWLFIIVVLIQVITSMVVPHRNKFRDSLRVIKALVTLCAVCGARSLCDVHTQQTLHINPMLDQCWPTVCDVGTTLVQHRVDVLYLLGNVTWRGVDRGTSHDHREWRLTVSHQLTN